MANFEVSRQLSPLVPFYKCLAPHSFERRPQPGPQIGGGFLKLLAAEIHCEAAMALPERQVDAGGRFRR